MADAFRAAFNDVWDRIPAPDRVVMLTHWRGQRPWSLSDDPFPAPVRYPVVRVIDLGAESSTFPLLSRAGSVFHFPANQTTERPWSVLIPQALAEAYRCATREHWRRVMELIEEPLAEWEGQQRGRVSEARRAKKAAVLEE